MALTIGTDTYISLADAKTYVTSNFATNDEKYIGWNALTDSDKEVYLRRATKRIDRQIYKGIKAIESQTLQFPRAFYSIDIYNRNIGLEIDNVHGEGWYIETEVKQCVKEAQVEESLALITQGTIFNKRMDLQWQGVKSISLGNLSETYQGIKKNSTNLISLVARELLNYAISGGVLIC